MNALTHRLAALALAALAGPAALADEAHLERWRSYAGVSWSADGKVFAGSVNAPIAGLHFDAQGRAFVSTPRLIAAGSPATLSLLDTAAPDGGPARLQAFPPSSRQDVKAEPAQQLRNVLGFHVDRRNGWLWALDLGFVAGEAEAPAGAQKLMVYELESGRLVKRIALDGAADRKGSFLNDLAVDEARRVAYLSDSGLRSAPANQAGLIVVDFESGDARRLLAQHPSVMPEAGVQAMAGGQAVWPGNPLRLGINGIALSPDASTLYWAVTTSTQAYALPTALLRDARLPAERLAAAVQRLGDVGGNTDGIVTDAAGRLYLTEVTRGGIVRWDPATRQMALLAASPQARWPDTAAITPAGHLVFTASSLNQHFAGAVKPGEERYELWRLSLMP